MPGMRDQISQSQSAGWGVYRHVGRPGDDESLYVCSRSSRPRESGSMTTLWRCDWCGETTEERDDVLLVDFNQLPSENNSLHVHPNCLPDDVRGMIDP